MIPIRCSHLPAAVFPIGIRGINAAGKRNDARFSALPSVPACFMQGRIATTLLARFIPIGPIFTKKQLRAVIGARDVDGQGLAVPWTMLIHDLDA